MDGQGKVPSSLWHGYSATTSSLLLQRLHLKCIGQFTVMVAAHAERIYKNLDYAIAT